MDVPQLHNISGINQLSWKDGCSEGCYQSGFKNMVPAMFWFVDPSHVYLKYEYPPKYSVNLNDIWQVKYNRLNFF